MKLSRPRSAFTLIELLAVIAIIGLIAALVGPSIVNWRKGDAMLAATRQMIDAVARARQLAISQHTTVYMVFLPPNYWERVTAVSPGWWPPNSTLSTPAQRIAGTNLADKQLTGYTYISLRGVGDQPGQGVKRYLSAWQTLPEGAFIAEWKFNWQETLLRTLTNKIADMPSREEWYKVYGFATNTLPFPVENASINVILPCIGFNYLGQLVSRDGQLLTEDEFIPLAHGSVTCAKDPVTKRPLFIDPAVMEMPAGNSSNTFNLIRIDRFTGRARLERQEIL